MSEDLLQELDSLRKVSEQLQNLTNKLQVPQMLRAEGKDGSGLVSVTLAQDGMPDRISVRNNWSRRIKPEQIGQSCLEAYGVAVSVRMQALSSQIGRLNWREVVDRDGYVEGDEELNYQASPSSSILDIGDIAEEAISLLAGVSKKEYPTGCSEANATSRVAITLSRGGLSSCEVDASWAGSQSGDRLTDELNSALRTARSALQRETEDHSMEQNSQQVRAQALIRNAMAIIQRPYGFAG